LLDDLGRTDGLAGRRADAARSAARPVPAGGRAQQLLEVALQARGVGVDPNGAAVAVCREKGHYAYRPEEFGVVYGGHQPDRQFDTLLCAHVLEHLDEPTGVELMRTYLPHLATGGRVVLITPQERGQKSDRTHVRFMDAAALTRLAQECGITIDKISSFPLPRRFGRWFVYNETITIARPATATGS